MKTSIAETSARPAWMLLALLLALFATVTTAATLRQPAMVGPDPAGSKPAMAAAAIPPNVPALFTAGGLPPVSAFRAP